VEVYCGRALHGFQTVACNGTLTSSFKPILRNFCHHFSKPGKNNGSGGIMPAGPDCVERSGPGNLPLRFSAADPAADGQTRTIEIDHRHVVLMRSVRGVPMRLNLSLAAYLGVSVRLSVNGTDSADKMALVLEHRDAALSVPLQIVNEETVVADWQRWGRLLGQKLLVWDGERLREPEAGSAGIQAGEASPRRPRRSALRHRRPKIFRRRNRAMRWCDAVVHRNEREIIARN
jgi:hypothetical protein